MRALLFYLFWIMISFGGYVCGRYLATGPLSEYIFVLAGLLGAALVTRGYGIFIEPGIMGNTRQRLVWLMALACIFSGIFITARVSNTQGNFSMAMATATLLLLACVLGHWLASSLKRPAELVPVCLVVAMSDMFSVFMGPTKEFATTIFQYYSHGMDGPIPLVDFFLVKFPMPGQDLFIPVFGITDWIVVVLLSAGAGKFELNDNILGIFRCRPLFFPAAGLGLVVAIAAAWALNRSLPALPFVAFFFLAIMAIKYPQIRRLTRSEIRPTIIIFLFIAGLAAALKIL